MKEIVLAGGCFWGVEAYFKPIKGVVSTRVGYANGRTESPSYKEVCSGETGHAEACQIIYNEEIIDLAGILKYFFKKIDPTILNDRGAQYRAGIYYTDEEEAAVIDDFIKGISSKYSSPIVVEVMPLSCFYDAEEYHQDYLTKKSRRLH